MPLVVKRPDASIRLELGDPTAPTSKGSGLSEFRSLQVALVNNMPDSALEDTESQYVELLNPAARDVNVELSCYSLPKVPRGARAKEYIARNYFELRELLSRCFDGVIVTGTEPLHSDLGDEPYWDELTVVMDWAEECAHSTVLSCLAAHAGVFHSDGILRQRLPDKRFGVFSEAIVADHPLTDSIATPICFPHSRWNDLHPEELSSHGYTTLTKSIEAGVGLFTKEKKNSLFVHFQGHPEYGERTLSKEYRRDVRRFLRGERETYPSLPQGYFDARETALLKAFQTEALKNRNEELMKKFPEHDAAKALQNSWRSTSVAIYCNWLRYIGRKSSQARHEHASLHSGHR